MDRKVIALTLLLSITAPLATYAETTDLINNEAMAELGINNNNPEVALDEIEGNRLEKTAVAAAAGAAIGSVWPGPGTVLGLVIGGAYGFFFK